MKRASAKRWTRHADLLAEGDWHVHSHWSADAQGTVHEYCQQARLNDLSLIAFTEHVRRRVPFDIAGFNDEIARAREDFPDLVILKGCEARVVNADGDLDAPDHVLDQCDIVIGAFQDFPVPSDYVTALGRMLRNPRIDIWGHPTLFAVENGIPLDLATAESLIDLCIDRQVLIEFNAKYRLPGDAVRALVVEQGAKYVFGSDAHQVTALRRRPSGQRVAPAKG